VTPMLLANSRRSRLSQDTSCEGSEKGVLVAIPVGINYCR